MQYRLPQQVHPANPALYQTGDERPNTGLREGLIAHSEVNDIIRANPKTVIFGQQTRLRNGVRLPDERLPRFHAGHDMVKFFYSAVRQLPEALTTALLDNEISVTLVQGPSLLVFHHPREHQSFHMGRTRKTIYIPERVLREAFEKGYDYWAISEVLIQESWPLLDYLLILETVRHLQHHYRRRRTIGYHAVKDTLRRLNKHLQDKEARDEDEFRIFFRYYADAFYELRRDILDRDPYDVADEIYDESRERFWTHLKLSDICDIYNYPGYFAIDRDICHGAAFRLAGELSMPLEPQTPADIMHDLWDEARFKISLSLKTEALLERLVEMGAEGLKVFLQTVAEEQVYGYEYVTINRYDGYNIFAGFETVLQHYSTGVASSMPGSLGYHYRKLHGYYLQQKRCAFFAQFRDMQAQAQEERLLELREMLYRVIEVRLHPSRAPDFKRAVEFAGSARALLDMGGQLLEEPDPGEESEHLCGLLAMLDRHPLYHTEFLEQYRALSGDDQVVIKQHIAPEVERLAGYLPEAPHTHSSDPAGVSARLGKFQQLRDYDPDDRQLFTLLAALLVRLDLAENYPELLDQIRTLGDYARPALSEIVADELFSDDQRAPIRKASRLLLAEL